MCPVPRWCRGGPYQPTPMQSTYCLISSGLPVICLERSTRDRNVLLLMSVRVRWRWQKETAWPKMTFSAFCMAQLWNRERQGHCASVKNLQLMP